MEARLYPIVDEPVDAPLEKVVKLTTRQANIREKINAMKGGEEKMVAERKTLTTFAPKTTGKIRALKFI